MPVSQVSLTITSRNLVDALMKQKEQLKGIPSFKREEGLKDLMLKQYQRKGF